MRVLLSLARWCGALGLLGLGLGCSRLVDSFVYLPEREVPRAPGSVGLAYEELRFPAEDGIDLHGWWVPGTRPAPCLLFLHGNAGNISDRLDILRRLHDRLGLGVLLFDYRGYGKSAGSPTEEGLYADVRGARALARARGWDSQGLVLYGRSLGAAVALQAAVEAPPGGLVLEGPFTTLADLAHTHYPLLSRLVGPWLTGAYDNLEKIPRLRAPLLILHGDRDGVVPIGMAWRLFDAAPDPKWFRTISGAGHDDPAFVGGEAYWEAWSRFLGELAQSAGPSASALEEGAGNPD